MTEFMPEGSSRETRNGDAAAAQPPQASSPWAIAPDQAEPPSMYAPPEAPAWNAPPPAWVPPPPKKRKAWPWVVGIVGGLVVLGGVGAAIAFAINGALNADQNENYTGSPITANDTPTLGDQVLVSDSERVAFDMGADWVNADEFVDIRSAVGPLPDSGTLVAAHFTADPRTAVDLVPSLVMVIEGQPANQVGPIDLEIAHEGFVSGNLRGLDVMGMDATVAGPTAVTTVNGLEGLVSRFSIEFQGVPIRAHEYTFVRSQRVVYIQIMAYTAEFDDATATLVTDSLRIDK